MSHTYVGIDPGEKGGIAVLYADHAEVYPMPPELYVLVDQLDAILKGPGLEFTICSEKLHSRPGQSSQSTFSFGERYGEIHGIVTTLQRFDPKAWQAFILGPRSAAAPDEARWTKAASIAHCRKTYPHVSLTPPGKRVAQDGMADALCIAEYAYRRANH